MPTNKKLADFNIVKMPQAVYNHIGNVNADNLHVITKDDSDTNIEVYSTQRIDELFQTTTEAVTKEATTSSAGLMSASDKAKLDKIAEEANKYVLPSAGADLGGVKTGGDVTIENGIITVSDDSHNHVIGNVDGLQDALDLKAPLASPALTGTPTAPTADAGTNTTQIATTAFVKGEIKDLVTGPTNAVNSHVAIFDGNTGKIIKDSTFTIGKSVPSDAVFTDTTYSDATGTTAGLMSAADKAKLDKIAEEANKYVLPSAGTDLGGVKTGGDVTIENGTITVNDDSHNHVIGNVDGLQDALDLKAPLASPALTGTPTAPTADANTNTTQIATTAFVKNAINDVLEASSAMTFEGTVGTGGTVTDLPASHTQGDTYVVATAGTYAGQVCEVGDMIVCNTNGTSANNAHWTVVQTNINGAITGSDANTLTVANPVAIFDGTNNRVIKSSNLTIAKSVPADAVFTDTVYTHPTHTAASSDFYKVTVDELGHVTAVVKVTKKDITDLGIPGSDTTYNEATTTTAGLMSAADKAKLDTVAQNASSTTITTYTSADIT